MNDETQEEWRPVVGYESRYEVSNLGAVRSVARTVPCGPPSGNGTRFAKSRILALQSDRYGYPTITLNMWKTTVHRVVAIAFIPNPDGHDQVNHKSGVKSDNRVANLEWCNASYNTGHSHQVLGKNTGETCWRSKLTNDIVIEARLMRARGMTFRAIAEHFGVRHQTIQHAIYRLSWRHVS